MDLVSRIWEEMKNHDNMTYYELGKRTNIPTATIRDYLNRRTKNITIDNVVLVADVFRMTVSELLGEVPEKEKYPDKVKALADIAAQLDTVQIDSLIHMAKTLLGTYKEDKPRRIKALAAHKEDGYEDNLTEDERIQVEEFISKQRRNKKV